MPRPEAATETRFRHACRRSHCRDRLLSQPGTLLQAKPHFPQRGEAFTTRAFARRLMPIFRAGQGRKNGCDPQGARQSFQIPPGRPPESCQRGRGEVVLFPVKFHALKLLAASLLLISSAMLSRRRTQRLITLFAWQGAILFVSTCLVAYDAGLT